MTDVNAIASISGGGTWYSHVGDLDFLTAWFGHPEFRMLK
ncbi:DUF6368 family protein [Kitasatospora sp. NPDC058162]